MKRINPLRISALLLALCMLLGLGLGTARAEADWQALQLTLTWTDAAGESQSAVAVPVAWSTDQSFWAQVVADAPLDQLTLSVAHPDHPEYVFQPGNGEVLQNVMDAAALDQMTMVTITASDETGNVLDTYHLYVSTQMMPEEPAATEAPAEEPSMEEPTEAPYVEEPTEEPYVEEPTEAPATEEPSTEEPTEAPATEETDAAPIIVDSPTADQPIEIEDEPEAPPEGPINESMDEAEPPATEAPETDAPVPPAATATVRISYVDEYGSVIAGPYEVALPGGMTSVIAPDTNVLPAGYEAVKADPISVTISTDGKADRTEIIFSYRKTVVETPIPVGEVANRVATVTGNQVALRSEPKKTKKNVLKRLEKGTVVYAIQSTKNDSGEVFYSVLLDGEGGYIQADFLDVMTQAASDAYQAANFTSPAPVFEKDSNPFATPAPEVTEAPATEAPATEAPATETPATEAPATEAPVTEAPVTEAPTNTPTVSPTAVPESYSGYALTQTRTALRSEMSTADQAIISTLDQQELVIVDGQEYDEQGNAWSRVETLSGQTGLMADASLRRINDQEADYYLRKWEEANATEVPATETPAPATAAPTPTMQPATPAPKATDEPPQVQGYAYTIGDNVYFRAAPSSESQILDVLGQHVPVWINGQQYIENEAWHIVKAGNQWGYIRADMLKLMSHTEVADYIKNITATENPQQATPNPATVEPQALSSYGYVSSSSVNLREKASKNSKKLKTLKQYAFSLILGTTQVDGQTWYRISYNGQTGYVDGRYFKQMNIRELENFLDSKEYAQGIANNKTQAAATAAPGSSGKVLSAEDQNVQRWTNPNSGTAVSYAPFNPFKTPEPISGTPAQPNTQLSGAITTVDPSGQKPDATIYQEYEHLYTTAINGGHTQVESLSQLNGVDVTKLSVIESGVYHNLKPDSKVIFDPATRKAYVSGMKTIAETTIQPVATESSEPMVTTDVLYPQEETQSGSIWGWLLLVIALVLAGGGIYGYTLFRKGQREAAQRAAAKRAAAQRAGAEGAKPYPQRAPLQPTSQPNVQVKQPNAPQNNPYQRATTAAPYERPVNNNPYARPQTGTRPAAPTTPVQPASPVQPTSPVQSTAPVQPAAQPAEQVGSETPSRRRRVQRNRMDDNSTDGGF